MDPIEYQQKKQELEALQKEITAADEDFFNVLPIVHELAKRRVEVMQKAMDLHNQLDSEAKKRRDVLPVQGYGLPWFDGDLTITAYVRQWMDKYALWAANGLPLDCEAMLLTRADFPPRDGNYFEYDDQDNVSALVLRNGRRLPINK